MALAAESGIETVAWDELQAPEKGSGALRMLPVLPDTRQLQVIGDDAAMIFFSSGTTGPQKAVMLSHRNIHAQFVISWSVNEVTQ